jgi:hypothetical protein
MTTGKDPRPAACVSGEPSPFPPHRLSAFHDGDLPAAELQVVRQHLEACAACAARAAELGALARAARTLEAPEPPPTLWSAIEGVLARETRPAPWWRAWRPLGVGAFVGASVGAALAAAVVLGWGARPAPLVAGRGAARAPAPASTLVMAPRAPTDPLLAEAEQEFARAAAVYERSIDKLRGLLTRESEHWSPEVRARYAERLTRLDDAIARSVEAARRAPAESEGNAELFAAYQQKLAFLTETVQRGGGWGQAPR